MTWFETNYDQAADIYLTVTDSCHGNALVAQDVSWDFRKRIDLFQSQISNKCLVYNVVAYSIPPGQTRRVFVADYFHSGNIQDN